MNKVKTVFFCQNCGAQSAKWIGKCPSCGEWNTYAEELIQKSTSSTVHQTGSNERKQTAKPLPIHTIAAAEYPRLMTPDMELNRVLGGGIVPGSIVLMAGEPGIGKSTLLLQVALRLESKKILYVSGEESPQQVKMRADRIGIKNDSCYVLAETNTALLFQYIHELKPDIVIVDSIQTLQTNTIESAAGSISQIRECASELQRYAKESGTPVFIIGHINKEGSIAGPKILEHMVDTVIQFEGDRHYSYRILRTLKNRFGSASELGIYEMQGEGLREVNNPSEILITQRNEPLSGICIAATLEGIRPLLIETQALVTAAVYGNPQRTATGFDLRRLSLLLAVLEKRCGFPFGLKDVFLNIAGGIKVEDPAIDLSIVAALISSFNDMPVSSSVCFAAEVGLSGEVRAINRVEQRISEAKKLGFERIYISQYNKVSKSNKGIQVIALSKVDQLIQALF
ncbi:MAG: DNA repair protein RadA [Bacteroidetes bacterium]|nr:DNA repair protein RadA [Bacteroidota bacterium]